MMRHARCLVLLLLSAAISGCGQPPPADDAVRLVPTAAYEPWSTPYGPGRQISTEHYQIFTTSPNRNLVENLPGFMEASYRNYLRLTRLSDKRLEEPFVFYVMGTRQEWAEMTRQAVPVQTDVYLSIEAGGYAFGGACVLWDLGGYSTLSVAAHEGMHLFLQRRLADQLPMWAEEGLCVMAEAYETYKDMLRFTRDRNAARFSHLRWALVQDSWLTAEKLLSMDAGDALGGLTEPALAYYGQLWAMMVFMQSRPEYSTGLHMLIADAEAGRLHQALGVSSESLQALRSRGKDYNRTVGAALFRHYITQDLGKFESQYLQFAKSLTAMR